MVLEGGLSGVQGEGAARDKVLDKLVIFGVWRQDVEGDRVLCDKGDVVGGVNDCRGELNWRGGGHWRSEWMVTFC